MNLLILNCCLWIFSNTVDWLLTISNFIKMHVMDDVVDGCALGKVLKMFSYFMIWRRITCWKCYNDSKEKAIFKIILLNDIIMWIGNDANISIELKHILLFWLLLLLLFDIFILRRYSRNRINLFLEIIPTFPAAKYETTTNDKKEVRQQSNPKNELFSLAAPYLQRNFTIFWHMFFPQFTVIGLRYISGAYIHISALCVTV